MSFNLQKYFKNQYLLEGDWDKLTSGEASDEADDIIELIKSAYAYIGGHSNFKDVGDVDKESGRGAEYEVIDLDDDGDIDAVNVSKRKAAGEKFVATGHDGSREAKRAVITHKIDRLKKPGFYVEVSGKIFDFRQGETVHTENSRKFEVDALQKLIGECGWKMADSWVDKDNLFSVLIFKAI